MATNLIRLCVLAHECLVIGCKCRSVVIDVQHSDVHWNTADLSWVVWETQGEHGDFPLMTSLRNKTAQHSVLYRLVCIHNFMLDVVYKRINFFNVGKKNT